MFFEVGLSQSVPCPIAMLDSTLKGSKGVPKTLKNTGRACQHQHLIPAAGELCLGLARWSSSHDELGLGAKKIEKNRLIGLIGGTSSNRIGIIASNRLNMA
jgi:hypothetical protein